MKIQPTIILNKRDLALIVADYFQRQSFGVSFTVRFAGFQVDGKQLQAETDGRISFAVVVDQSPKPKDDEYGTYPGLPVDPVVEPVFEVQAQPQPEVKPRKSSGNGKAVSDG